MERRTFIAICQVAELNAHGASGDPAIGMRVYDTYGNGESVLHLLPEYRRDHLVFGDPEDIVAIAHEVAPVVMDIAKDLVVRGEPFDIGEWRSRKAAEGAAPKP